MVLAAKVFIIREECDLETVASKLRNYRVDDLYQEGETHIQLYTEVRDLLLTPSSLQAVFSQDFVHNIYHRGQVRPVPRTMEAPIIISKYGDSNLLTVLEKKQRANNVANQLSRLLFITPGKIVEAKIDPEVLRGFHEKNLEDTKIVFFDGVDLPNIEKLSLYGSALANTGLYSEYLSHGNIWYVVIKSKKYGYVIGLTRNTVATVFSRISEQEFTQFISDEIFPLISL